MVTPGGKPVLWQRALAELPNDVQIVSFDHVYAWVPSIGFIIAEHHFETRSIAHQVHLVHRGRTCSIIDASCIDVDGNEPVYHPVSKLLTDIVASARRAVKALTRHIAGV